jgi:hypothetical protein
VIRARRLYLGLLATAVGWQVIARLTGAQPRVVGFLLVTAGLAVVALSLPSRRLYRSRAVASVLVTQMALLPGVVALLARWRSIWGLDRALATLVRGFGGEAVASDGSVVMQIGGMPLAYFPSLSRLGAFPVLLLLGAAGGLALLLPLRRPGRFFLRVVVAVLGITSLRVLILVTAQFDLPELGVDSSPWLLLLSFAPGALLLPADHPLLSEAHQGVPASGRDWRPYIAGAVGFGWVLTLGWVDPGVVKEGRILFDDAHGEWEPTDTPFDTDSYGQRLAYSYSSLYRLLDGHYAVTRHRHGPLTDESMRDIDILIVKTPTEPFSVAEIDAIDRFVEEGGGLFLIGDHTNLFGMSQYLNQLARRFGLAFELDDTFDLMTEAQSFWGAPAWLAHPIARRVEAFEFETSCTLDVPLRARAPIIGYGLGAEPADYSRPGFFGDLHPDPDEDFGFFVQHAVVDHGAGRVAAFSDSTTFSNFSLYFPGRRELVLATVEHLNRSSTAWQHLPLLAFLLTVTGVFLLSGHRPGGSTWATLAALVLGLAAGTGVTRAADRLSLPEPSSRIPQIAFDRSLSSLVLPNVLTMDEELDSVAMDSFFVATQRLGHQPLVVDRLSDEALESVTLLVLAHPDRVPTEAESAALARYVSRGGRLLVIDGLLRRGSATSHVLGPFGLGVEVLALESSAEATANDAPTAGLAVDPGDAADSESSDARSLAFLRPALAVWGGRALLQDPDGRVIFSETSFGRGRVGALVDAFTVSKSALGSRFIDNPTPAQQKHLETVYEILRRMSGSDRDRAAEPPEPREPANSRMLELDNQQAFR